MLVTTLHPLSHPGRHILHDCNSTDQQDTQYQPGEPAIETAYKGHDKGSPDMGKGFYHRSYSDDRRKNRKEMDQFRPFTVHCCYHEEKCRMTDEEFFFPRPGIHNCFQEAPHGHFDSRYGHAGRMTAASDKHDGHQTQESDENQCSHADRDAEKIFGKGYKIRRRCKIMAHEREPPQRAYSNDDNRQDKRKLDAAIIVKLHEEPDIPNFKKFRRGIKLKSGMTLAVEPMINIGTPDVLWLDDEWTVITADMSLSAHYENTIIITEGRPEILTLTDSEIAAHIWE